jgi:SAM-dependent MidA family methyltransferase
MLITLSKNVPKVHAHAMCLIYELQVNLHSNQQNELPDHMQAFLHHPILHQQAQHTLLEKDIINILVNNISQDGFTKN